MIAQSLKILARKSLPAVTLSMTLFLTACGGSGNVGGGSTPPTPGVTATPASITLAEGASTTFNVVLNTQPTANVTIAVTSLNTAEATTDVTSLTFTATGGGTPWDAPQPVTVTGVLDNIVDGNKSIYIELDPAASVDADYAALAATNVATTVLNIDTACRANGHTVGTTINGSVTKTVLADITTAGDYLTVTVPDPGGGAVLQSVGLVLDGCETGYKVIDHGKFLTDGGWPVFITIPGGGNAPLSLNGTDANGDGTDESTNGAGLGNWEAASIFFPNDGLGGTLPFGDYIFPVAAFNASGTALVTDTMTPIVYYKTSAVASTTLELNVVVPDGVISGVNTVAGIAANSVISGMVAVMKTVYETKAGLTLKVNYARISSSYGIVDNKAEDYALHGNTTYLEKSAGYNPEALEVYVIAGFGSYMPTGVLGISAGIPGPFDLPGTTVSGVLGIFSTQADLRFGGAEGTAMGFIMAHEVGHFLGLFHTSQTNATQDGIVGHDPLADTANCANSNLPISSCPDRPNLMFPIVDNNANPDFSTQQSGVVKANPSVN